MQNRFLEMDEYLTACSPGKTKKGLLKKQPGLADNVFDDYGISSGQSMDWSSSLSAQQRVLVILIENGGVDLGIPELADKLLSIVPSYLVNDSLKTFIKDTLRKKIKEFTDNLLENAELTLNRYTAAKPNYFGDVIVLRNGNATNQQLSDTLIRVSKEGKLADIFILTHGYKDNICLSGGKAVTGDDIRAIKNSYGKPLSIRSVYMMNCVGSSLNKAWMDAGARVSSGSAGNNYLPEPTMYFFWNNWKSGQNFETAVTSAYRKTINVMNEAVRSAVSSVPGGSIISPLIKFEDFDFVKESNPLIQGQRSLTINSDELNFSQSLYNSFATTVLPVSLLQSLLVSESMSDGKPKPWKWSQQALDMIKQFEEFREKKYDDVTKDEAIKSIMDRIEGFQKAINDNVTVDLNQNQFDALLSFVYNIGTEQFKKSTLLNDLLNNGKYKEVPDEMKKWTQGKVNDKMVDLPGLVTRRNAESSLFATAVSTSKSMGMFSSMQTVLNGTDLNNLLSDAMPVRVLTLTQARDILQTLQGNAGSGLILDAPPFNGSLKVSSQRKWVVKVKDQPDVQKDETHDVPRTYTVKPATINGIAFKYMNTAAGGVAQANLNNLDPRMVVFLYKFTRWLKSTWGTDTIYHMGIGHGNGPQFDCHNTGRALDLGGLKGVYNGNPYELFVLRDWGSKPQKMNGGNIFYRLAPADGLAYSLFKDVYRYMVTQMSDTSHYYEPAKTGADLDSRLIQDNVAIPSNFIIHPDHHDATLRAHHNNHFHVQVGSTSYEANPPV